MKKKTFLKLFIATQIIGITLYIHKESYMVKISYQKQQILEVIKKTTAQKQHIFSTLCELKNPATIKTYATKTLGMEPLHLKKIKRIFL